MGEGEYARSFSTDPNHHAQNGAAKKAVSHIPLNDHLGLAPLTEEESETNQSIVFGMHKTTIIVNDNAIA